MKFIAEAQLKLRDELLIYCVRGNFFLWVSVWILSLWMQHKLHNISNDCELRENAKKTRARVIHVTTLWVVSLFGFFSDGVECRRRCSACHARLNAKNQNKHLQCRRLMMMAHFMSERECPIHLHIFLYILSLVCRVVKYINYIVIHLASLAESIWINGHRGKIYDRRRLFSC